MRKNLRHIASIAVAIAAGLLAGATAASAADVTVTPGGTTAGSASTSQFVLNTVRRTINCTTTGYNATYVAGTFLGVSLPFTFSDSTNAQLTFSGCRVVGGLNVTFSCARTTRLNANGFTAGAAGVTQISITSITCTVSASATCRVTISGGLPGDHNNTLGQITVATTGQTVTATGSTNGSGGTCSLLPNDGSVTFLGNSTPPNVVYTESPAQRITVV